MACWEDSYTRAELAKIFYDKLGAVVNIQECEIEEFAFKDVRPLNISMSNLKFKKETGYQFADMDSVIEMYINNIKATMDIALEPGAAQLTRVGIQ